MDIPMVDEDEWAEIHPLIRSFVIDTLIYMLAHRVTWLEAKRLVIGRRALNRYFDITGFRETNINAIWHHRSSIYGPPCRSCGKPLRTPKARFCAACGEDA
jgi:hypothetical protein